MLKKYLIILFVSVTMSFYAQNRDDYDVVSNDEIVLKQVEAYNNRDLKAFAFFYTDDVVFFDYPNTLLLKGKKAFKERFIKRFENTNLHCEVKSKIIFGSKIIYEEYIQTEQRSYTVIAIYELENKKIKKLTFIRK